MTTFTYLCGTFEFKYMSFQLCNDLAASQSSMLPILLYMVEYIMKVFMDDFLVIRDPFKVCLDLLRKVPKNCVEKNLAINWKKCHFIVKEGIVSGTTSGAMTSNRPSQSKCDIHIASTSLRERYMKFLKTHLLMFH